MKFITCNAQMLKNRPATKAYDGPNTIINILINSIVKLVYEMLITSRKKCKIILMKGGHNNIFISQKIGQIQLRKVQSL